jgi:sulfur dioxygenase
MLVFRQLFDPTSSTYSYLLADARSREAVLIDPVFDLVRRDAALLRELDLVLVATIDTHVHADHVTGAWLLKERCGSQVMVARATRAEGADRYLQHGDRVALGGRFLEVRATPGHTAGCLTLVLDDETMAFVGDCLLIRGSGRTDLQQGNAREMYRSVRSQIFTLPPACLLYPAHDYRGLTVTSVEEERRFNPRLGGEIAEADFVGYMTNLGLPHPKLIDIAVPANMKCGRPAAAAQQADPKWAPLTFTFAGIFEINPAGLEECIANVQVVDVRERDEFDGPMGRIAGSRWIPLGELAGRAGEFAKDRPVVAVCRSGARSAHAVSMLSKLGFSDVANLAGGILRWSAEGLPVEGGRRE